ncbi:2Fe-2S iron-sulfur cluster binding domain-containing protein [Candidatus Sumerlaeota bacterium]|nr:2Fe-2S iron-sulfur cluster binding domain-containing protein [Candidatus Sumerlaeota bacterium]
MQCEGRRSCYLACCLAATVFAPNIWATRALAQISPEEHAKHHPNQAGGAATSGMTGMMDSMGDMMKSMMGGNPPPKALYPSLMDMPELTPEKREQIEAMASQRLADGARRMGEGMDQLLHAVNNNDASAMRSATTAIREGVADLESGTAAREALQSGKPPRQVALAWLRSEMNLLPSTNSEHGAEGVFGLSWFHFFVMAILTVFAMTMIWMYFHKMRRATELLQQLASPQAQTQLATSTGAPPPAAAKAVDWTGKVRIARIFQETPQVKTFRLISPEGGDLPFVYKPGQFVTLTASPEGKPVKRSYTMSSSPTRGGGIDLTVKREEHGLFSRFLDDRAKEGDLLDIRGPFGRFTFTGSEAKNIVLIAGGVGVTPFMSMIRYLTDRCWPGEIALIYSCRTPAEFIFGEEIEHLARRFPNFRPVITMTRAAEGDWNGRKGRITKDLMLEFAPDIRDRRVYICGPTPMIQAMKALVQEIGVSADLIKTEAFGGEAQKPELPSAAPGAAATVTFARSAKSAPMSTTNTILDAAESVGVEIDNSCRVGTCGTCKVHLIKGEVTMECEDALDPAEKSQGIILACQAKSKGDVTVEA